LKQRRKYYPRRNAEGREEEEEAKVNTLSFVASIFFYLY
jgi:hypothetical protein